MEVSHDSRKCLACIFAAHSVTLQLHVVLRCTVSASGDSMGNVEAHKHSKCAQQCLIPAACSLNPASEVSMQCCNTQAPRLCLQCLAPAACFPADWRCRPAGAPACHALHAPSLSSLPALQPCTTSKLRVANAIETHQSSESPSKSSLPWTSFHSRSKFTPRCIITCVHTLDTDGDKVQLQWASHRSKGSVK